MEENEIDTKDLEQKIENQNLIENLFERVLWNCRFVVLLAVIFGLISAITLFVLGSIEVVSGIHKICTVSDYEGTELVGTLIGAVDYFLIGVVLLIFSFGIYELFISHLEIGRLNEEVKILEITNLDDLKNRIIKVVIMVLIVSFFKKILSTEFNTALEMLYFACSIFVLCIGVYFMHKAH